jgi:hypothetical protein
MIKEDISFIRVKIKTVPNMDNKGHKLPAFFRRRTCVTVFRLF